MRQSIGAAERSALVKTGCPQTFPLPGCSFQTEIRYSLSR
jgi:hypothetical protein